MKLRFRKVDAGHYRAINVPTTLDGEPIKVTIDVFKIGSYGRYIQWLVGIHHDGRELSHLNYDTKREATFETVQALEAGFYSDWDLYGYTGEFYINPPPSNQPPLKPEWGGPPWKHKHEGAMKPYTPKREYLGYNIRQGAGNAKPTKEMLRFFKQRTQEHINRVIHQMEALKGFEGLPTAELVERALTHDKDKYTDSELILPYIWVTEYYRVKNGEDSVDAELQEQYDLASEATGKHVEKNLHHPEAHSSTEEMTLLDLAEMVCDWFAMAEELGEDSARGWADENVGSKWEFSPEQTESIYDLIDWLEESGTMKKHKKAATLPPGVTVPTFSKNPYGKKREVKALWPFKGKLPKKFSISKDCVCTEYGMDCSGPGDMTFEKTKEGWKVEGKLSPLQDEEAKFIYESCGKKAASVKKTAQRELDTSIHGIHPDRLKELKSDASFQKHAQTVADYYLTPLIQLCEQVDEQSKLIASKPIEVAMWALSVPDAALATYQPLVKAAEHTSREMVKWFGQQKQAKLVSQRIALQAPKVDIDPEYAKILKQDELLNILNILPITKKKATQLAQKFTAPLLAFCKDAKEAKQNAKSNPFFALTTAVHLPEMLVKKVGPAVKESDRAAGQFRDWMFKTKDQMEQKSTGKEQVRMDLSARAKRRVAIGSYDLEFRARKEAKVFVFQMGMRAKDLWLDLDQEEADMYGSKRAFVKHYMETALDLYLGTFQRAVEGR